MICVATHINLVRMGLLRGADINTRNNFGNTPIHARKARFFHDADADVLTLFVRNTKIGKSKFQFFINFINII